MLDERHHHRTMNGLRPYGMINTTELFSTMYGSDFLCLAKASNGGLSSSGRDSILEIGRERHGRAHGGKVVEVSQTAE